MWLYVKEPYGRCKNCLRLQPDAGRTRALGKGGTEGSRRTTQHRGGGCIRARAVYEEAEMTNKAKDHSTVTRLGRTAMRLALCAVYHMSTMIGTPLLPV
jgi:hypothetical protein